MRGRLLVVAALVALSGCSADEDGLDTDVSTGCPDRVELAGGVPRPDPVEPELPLEVQDGRLCRYDASGGLTGEEPLAPAGLGEALLLPRAFGGQAPACPPDPQAVPLLLVLTTPRQVVQVGTADDPAGCAPTLVGALESAVHLGVPGRRDPDEAARCAPGRPGRSGQEASLVPGEPVALVACRTDGAGTARRTGTPADLALVQQVLGEPPAVPRGASAPCTPQVEGELHLRYASGPPVLVRLRPGCSPAVDNGSLAADLPAPDLARLVALLPG